MCGIAGAVGHGNAANMRAQLDRAVARLSHRGPDAAGTFHELNVALGHRRLSILDTAARANQPMQSPSGNTVIVLNGEVYNFGALRNRLSAKGERFATTSDTEVLLRLLESEGERALVQVQGMFSFAVWDRANRELLLARDRFGEKPLYFAIVGQGIVFASEITALLELMPGQRRLDAQALRYFLEYGYVPAPLTMFADVKLLEPGSWLKWREGKTTTGTYYVPDYSPDPALEREADAATAVRAALSAAVSRQMVSDVPLGAFLSGGIDSSSVVALMQQHSNKPVQTFNIRFEDAVYDESPVARRVAQHLGTEHHELTVTDTSFQDDDLNRIIDHVGLPLHDSSAIPTFIVSKFARSLVSVALSGDGGDELFAGYPVYRWATAIEPASRLPGGLLRAAWGAATLAGRFPPLGASSVLRQTRKAFALARMPSQMARFRAAHWLFSPDEARRLVDPDLSSEVQWSAPDILSRLPEGSENWTHLQKMLFSRLRYDLPDDMLTKVDRMSMAVSLEVRAPFLDSEVSSLAMRLPDRHLIKRRIGKHILREAMKPFLPPEVFSHRKWGFSIPLHRFINARFAALAGELLRADGPLRGIVLGSEAERIRARGLCRTADRADISVYQATHQLWALMQLAAWVQRFDVSPA